MKAIINFLDLQLGAREVDVKMKKLIFFLIAGIFLVSFASAQGCCVKLKLNGGWCQPASSAQECAINSFFDSVSPTCDAYPEYCGLITCYDSSRGECSPSTPKKLCEENGGEVVADGDQRCVLGCCESLGRNMRMMTQNQCLAASEGQSVNVLFNTEKDETTCKYASIEQGACVQSGLTFGSNCVRSTEAECVDGTFYKGDLCSKHESETGCRAQEKISCGNQEGGEYNVYWYDSCEQKENIYLGNTPQKKIESNNTGRIMTPEKESGSGCNQGGDCGKCNYPDSNICSPFSGSSNKVKAGDYYCKKVDCPDAQLNGGETGLKKNQEEWCLFDGFVGKAKDTVGSEHYLARCDKGEVVIDEHSTMRDYICHEVEYNNGRTQASMIDNTNSLLECQAINKLTTSEEKITACSQNPLCTMIQGLCTAAYPMGKSFWNEDLLTEQQSCGKKEGGPNEDGSLILGGDYVDRMGVGYSEPFVKWAVTRNNYCTSLGDCGDYINYLGDYGSQEEAMNNYERGTFNFFSEIDGRNYTNYIPLSEEKTNFVYDEIDYNSHTTKEAINFSDSVNGQKVPGDYKGYPIIVGYSVSGGFLGESCKSCEDCTSGFFASEVKCNNCNNCGGGIRGTKCEDCEDCGNEGNCESCKSCEIETGEKTNSFPSGMIFYSCNTWKAPLGGDKCELCNNDFLPCTEYKCKSLGSTCEIKTPDTDSFGETVFSDVQFCYDSAQCSKNEITNTEITSVELSEGFDSSENGRERNIWDKAIPNKINENQQIEIIFNTKEYAECWWSKTPIVGAEIPTDSIVIPRLDPTKFNLTLTMPDADDLDWLSDGETFTANIQCSDVCGNPSTEPYKFIFKVRKTPDTLSPRIYFETTETFIPFNSNEGKLKVFADEVLAECKYSFSQSTPYEQMINTFSTCIPYSPDTINYFCETTVGSLNMPEQKIVYVKCKDTSGNINVDSEEESHTFIKSKAKLKISSVTPTDGQTFKKSFGEGTNKISFSISTTGGLNDDGLSSCNWTFDNMENIAFLDNPLSTHNLDFDYSTLRSGSHVMRFNCKDDGGNSATNQIQFNIEVDRTAPLITRVSKEGSSLVLTTDEIAICYYDNSTLPSCSFIPEQVEKIDGTYVSSHPFSFNSDKTYYIKCEDPFRNANSGCAMIVKGTNFR